MRLKLVTPDRVVEDRDVESVSLPTVMGEITILPHHASITAVLVPGVVRVKSADGGEDIAVSGGFIHVENHGQVTVLAETAERGHELTMATIEEARERAKKVMSEAVRKDDVQFAAAAAALERELARFKVAKKHHHEKGTNIADQANFSTNESAE